MKADRIGTMRYGVALLSAALLIVTTTLAGCGKSPSSGSDPAGSVYESDPVSAGAQESRPEDTESAAASSTVAPDGRPASGQPTPPPGNGRRSCRQRRTAECGRTVY